MEVGLKIIGRLDVRREQDQRVYDGGGYVLVLGL